jgi:CSLREA domain-containing protein
MASHLRVRAAVVSIVTLVPFAAHATTFTVNSAADAGGTCPGATCTLRQAIATASPGDTINFAAGIATINLTSTDSLTIEKNLTINGPGANLLTVSGNDRAIIFYVRFSNLNVAISGLTISNALGGIYSEPGTLTITNSTISNNAYSTSIFSAGGGIYSNGGTLTITNSTISGNTASVYDSELRTDFAGGGGIFNNGGTVTITNSTISGNTASRSGFDYKHDFAGGGGIYNNGGTVTVTNSTISGNTAFSVHSSGGGIYSNGGTVTTTNSTISGNTASGPNPDSAFASNRGGGVGSGGTVNARNTIIAGNMAFTAPDYFGTLTSQGYNLIGNGDKATITPTTGDQIGTAASPINPRLGPLQDNGGPTVTMALLSGSPARDKGDSGGANTDQRGFTRPVDNSAFPNAAGGDGSDIGAFEIQAGVAAKSLNISTRARVQTGDNVLIGGFIITGNVPKRVVLRALGPSLANAGVPAAAVLNDPVLELHGASGALIISNDNWKDSPQRAQIEGTLFQPTDDREAVILTTLPPAGYTAVVRGVANGTGVGVVEVYDLDQSTGSTLANISSRAFVETGNNVVIGGFILGGPNGSPQIIIRGLGPSLANFGIANPLANPTLELRDANATLLASVDDWASDSAQASQIIAVGLQPQVDREAAIAAALPPGAYTAILAGKSGGTGVALVEIYNLQ